MGIVKLIFIFIIVWLVLSLYKNLRSKVKPIKHKQKVTNKMVQCHKCQVHIPINEAILSNDFYYCDKHKL
jgi:choline-glycine betaine transporter